MNSRLRLACVGLVLSAFAVCVSDAAIDAAAIYRRASPSVGLVISLDASGQPLALGSGFFVDGIGTFATNFHVIAGAASVRVRVSPTTLYDIAMVGGFDTSHDLALLVTGASGVTPSPMAKSAPSVGEDIVALGNPLGLERTLSTGVVSGIRTFEDGTQLYQITAPISPGSSGGPVLNGAGEVIGVATAALDIGQNLNFAVPTSAMVDLLSRVAGKPPVPLSRASGQRAPERKNLTLSPLRCVAPELSISYPSVVRFSLVNEGTRPLRNARVLAVYYANEKGSSTPLHFTPVQVAKVVPPGLGIRVQARDEVLNENRAWYHWRVEFRILDFEIVPSADVEFEFVPGN